MILFEPSSSEHISARTIFDPINALAPAADCRTYAIGYDLLPSPGRGCPETGNVRITESGVQVSERFHPHLHAASRVHHLTYPDDLPRTVGDCRTRLACVILEAKVRYVGHPDGGRGSPSLERGQTAHGGIASRDPSLETFGAPLRGSQVDCVVEEWEDRTVCGWVRISFLPSSSRPSVWTNPPGPISQIQRNMDLGCQDEEHHV